MKLHTDIAMVALAVLAFAGTASTANAQDGPFAPGPIHPMVAPLSPTDPMAQLDPRLLNVPPMMPEADNNPVVNNKIIEHDAMTGMTNLSTGSSGLLQDGTVSPGSGGSINIFGNEPNGNSGGSTHGIQTIFGADQRQLIANAVAYPWRANCKIYMKFPDNSTWQASCTLIAGKYAITAGHCVYSKSNGGWAKQIQVIPALSGTYKPYGAAWATYMRTYTGWTVSGNNQYDMAVITLDRSIGATTGWFGYGYWSNLNGVTGNLSAYDADVNSTYQKYRFGLLTQGALTIYYTMDTMPGSSGGGVYRIIGTNRYVDGDNNWQYSITNMGVKITSSRFTDIHNWIATGF